MKIKEILNKLSSSKARAIKNLDTSTVDILPENKKSRVLFDGEGGRKAWRSSNGCVAVKNLAVPVSKLATW